MTGKYEEVLAVDYQVLCEKCDRLMRYNGKWVCGQCGATVTVHKKVEACTQ